MGLALVMRVQLTLPSPVQAAPNPQPPSPEPCTRSEKSPVTAPSLSTLLGSRGPCRGCTR